MNLTQVHRQGTDDGANIPTPARVPQGIPVFLLAENRHHIGNRLLNKASDISPTHESTRHAL